MASKQSDAVLRHIRSILGAAPAAAGDAELLEAFVARREEAAFAALLRRHGPMVWAVGRRHLGQAADVEDVFQATFLLLARDAGRIRKPGSVGSWLHGVAHRLAVRVRSRQAQRQTQERRAQAVQPTMPPDELARRELHELLDQALERLPEKYRTALVLCYLEGKTQEEAARQLGCPLGTVRSWLARGRDLLRKRLARRGVTLSAAGFTALLAASTAHAQVPPAVVNATLRFVAGGAAAAGAISAPVAALLEGGSVVMTGVRLKLVLAFCLMLGTITAGTVAYPLLASGQPAKQAEGRPPPAVTNPAAPDPADDPLPDGAVARLGSMRDRHGHWVYSVRFSPDGKILATGSADQTVRLVEVATGKELRRLKHEGGVGAVAFSPDGKALASGGFDNSIRLWDPATGKELRRFTGHEQGVQSLAFSPDGKLLASGSWDHTVRVWEVATGKERRRMAGHTEVAHGVAFAPDGKLLASGSRDKTARLWEVATGKQVHELAHGPGERPWSEQVETVAFSPDGKIIASAGYDNAVTLWDAATGRKRRTLTGHGHWVCSVAFSPDGRTLVSGSIDRTIRTWETATGKELRRWPAHRLGVFSVTFSPDGKLVASGSEDQTAALWDPATGQEIRRLSLPLHRVRAMAFAPDGRTLVTASAEDDLALWDVPARKELRRFRGHQGLVSSVAFAPDGRRLVSGGSDRTVRLWQAATGKELLRREGLPAEITAIAFSVDGKRIASGDNGNEVRLWDAATGKLLRKIQVPSSVAVHQIDWLAFSPDGQALFTGARPDPTLRMWDVATGREVRPFAPAVFWGALAPNGQAVAAVSGAQKINVWEVATGNLRHSFPIGQQSSSEIAYSPDLKTLATHDYWGHTITLWDLPSGRQLAQFKGHHGPIPCLAFAPDSKTVVSGSYDNTLLIWDVARYARKRPPPGADLAPAEVRALWAVLAEADAPRAFDAIRGLVSGHRQAIPFLQEHLRPAPAVAAPDPRRLQRLIRDLDSDQFKVREQAAAELEKLERAAEPALRKALEGNPSPEVRRRCERLLQRLGEPGVERLRQRRAIEVLEMIGTPEAAGVLRAVAQGEPAARLTAEAGDALKRLARRGIVRP